MNVVSGAACIGTTGGTGSAANSGSPVKRRTARTNKRFIPKRKRPLRASTNVNVSIQSRKDTKNSAHNPPALIPDTLIHYSPQHLSLTLWLTEGLLVPSTYTVPIPLITGPPLGPLTGVGGEEGRWARAHRSRRGRCAVTAAGAPAYARRRPPFLQHTSCLLGQLFSGRYTACRMYFIDNEQYRKSAYVL